jgi:hypothetical protein
VERLRLSPPQIEEIVAGCFGPVPIRPFPTSLQKDQLSSFNQTQLLLVNGLLPACDPSEIDRPQARCVHGLFQFDTVINLCYS